MLVREWRRFSSWDERRLGESQFGIVYLSTTTQTTNEPDLIMYIIYTNFQVRFIFIHEYTTGTRSFPSVDTTNPKLT